MKTDLSCEALAKQEHAADKAQEWTAEKVKQIASEGHSLGISWQSAKALSVAINASIAAERENFLKSKEWNQVVELELLNLRSLWNEMMYDMAQLSNELASERDAYALALQMKNIETTRANESENKVAAAQQPLVDALIKCEKVLDCPGLHHARASKAHIEAWKSARIALVKVK